MAFYKKFFNIKKSNYHNVISILGFKFKLKSLEHVNSGIVNLRKKIRPDLVSFRKKLFWGYEDKITTREKIWFISTRMYEKTGYYPNLKEPKSFNEKLHWMNFNYDNALVIKCADKYEFKNYIKEKLGDGYTIPLIGVYDDVNDIDFDSLPDSFIIKSTILGSGMGIIKVNNKKNINIDKIKFKCNNWLQDWSSIYYSCLSYAYKGVKPRIIIEKYEQSIEQSPNEYKIFCFHGEPKMFYYIDYYKNKEWTYYDMDLNRLPVINEDYDCSLKMSSELKHKPSKNYNKMIEISKQLAKDFPFVRVDFYDTEDKLFVGEMTFTPTGAFAKYTPTEWDYKFGEMLDLSKIPEENLKILPEFVEGAKTFIPEDVVERCMVK